ncbi:protein CASC4-like [Limulus polyphemus]|uniref:Protein CASC4-like n=1 Tax=Limulus polyphemus TaxID=6850 RepID=A0ABM1S347_LIMPO|nr:protein CASC4-like [Limulus polyphemus]
MKSFACLMKQNKIFSVHIRDNPLCIQGCKEHDDKTFTSDSTFPFDSSFSIEEKHDSSCDIASTGSFNSSLGILNTSKLSSVSMEGKAGGNTSRDFIDLLNEVEELGFHNKKLQAENERLRAQISQSEETTNQLMTENEQLRLKVSSFQNVLEKTKDLEKEYEEMKTSFEQEEKMRIKLEDSVANLQKENRHLLSQQKDLEQELLMTNSMLEKYKKEEELVIFLEDQVQDLIQQKEIWKMELEEKTSVCEELHQVVKEYTKANEVLQQDKSILEVELYKAQEEIQSIAEAVGSSYNHDEDVGEDEDYCETEDLIYHIQTPHNISLQKHHRFQNCISLQKRKEPVYSSTPHQNNFMKNISICAEMKDLIHANDSLPTPICGKEQSFLSCSGKAESPVPCGDSLDGKVS